jgi:type III secretory pathway component EscV
MNRRRHTSSVTAKENQMLVLGIVLLLIGLLAGIPILWTIGLVLALVGAVLLLAERSGAGWGRRWY